MRIKYRAKWMAKMNYFTLVFFYALLISLFWVFFYDSFEKDILVLMIMQLGATVLLQLFFLTQRRVNRGIVVLLFNLCIYYLCFFFFITKIDLTGLLNKDFAKPVIGTGHSITNEVSWITTYMNVNLLIVSLSIHVLLFVFFIYDYLWNRLFVQRFEGNEKFTYFTQTAINLFFTLGISIVVFWAFRTISSDIMGKNFVLTASEISKLNKLNITKDFVENSLDNYTKLLNIIIYPFLSLFSSLIRASAVGDNSSIKNIGFKMVVIFFTAWNVERDGLVIWIILMTYFIYSVVFIIVLLSSYFTEAIEKQKVPLNYLFESEREVITVNEKSSRLWTTFFRNTFKKR